MSNRMFGSQLTALLTFLAFVLFLNLETISSRERALLDLFNSEMEHVARRDSVGFVSINSQNFETKDLFDDGHFTYSGTDKFSRMIAKQVFSLCGLE